MAANYLSPSEVFGTPKANYLNEAEVLGTPRTNYLSQDEVFGKPEPTPEEQSGFRSVTDVPLKVAGGVTQGVRMIADLFGADNPVSKQLRGAEDWIAQFYSAQSKQDAKEVARLMDEAKDKGVWEQVKAAGQAFATAPIDMIAQGLGTAAPAIAATLGMTVFGVPAALIAGTAVGAGMGAGTVKGSIYDAVKEELKKTDMPPDEIEKRAVLAQEYGGENLGLILGGGAIGALTGRTGLEGAALRAATARVLGKKAEAEAAEAAAGTAAREAAREATKTAAERGVAKQAGVVAGKEFGTEALQGGFEQAAQNVALQREGFDVPTFQGVAGSATLEALSGAGLGAGFGAREAAVAKREQARLDRLDQIGKTLNVETPPADASVDDKIAALSAQYQKQMPKDLADALAQRMVADAERRTEDVIDSGLTPPSVAVTPDPKIILRFEDELIASGVTPEAARIEAVALATEEAYYDSLFEQEFQRREGDKRAGAVTPDPKRVEKITNDLVEIGIPLAEARIQALDLATEEAQGASNVRRPAVAPSGEGVSVAAQPDATAATSGAPITQPTGVDVAAAPAGPAVGGTAPEQTTVTPTTLTPPTPPAPPTTPTPPKPTAPALDVANLTDEQLDDIAFSAVFLGPDEKTEAAKAELARRKAAAKPAKPVKPEKPLGPIQRAKKLAQDAFNERDSYPGEDRFAKLERAISDKRDSLLDLPPSQRKAAESFFDKEIQKLKNEQANKGERDPVEFAKGSAAAAIDQRNDQFYTSVQDAIDSYRQNMLDTLSEMGVKDAYVFARVERAFDAAIDAELANQIKKDPYTTTPKPGTLYRATTAKQRYPGKFWTSIEELAGRYAKKATGAEQRAVESTQAIPKSTLNITALAAASDRDREAFLIGLTRWMEQNAPGEDIKDTQLYDVLTEQQSDFAYPTQLDNEYLRSLGFDSVYFRNEGNEVVDTWYVFDKPKKQAKSGSKLGRPKLTAEERAAREKARQEKRKAERGEGKPRGRPAKTEEERGATAERMKGVRSKYNKDLRTVRAAIVDLEDTKGGKGLAGEGKQRKEDALHTLYEVVKTATSGPPQSLARLNLNKYATPEEVDRIKQTHEKWKADKVKRDEQAKQELEAKQARAETAKKAKVAKRTEAKAVKEAKKAAQTEEEAILQDEEKRATLVAFLAAKAKERDKAREADRAAKEAKREERAKAGARAEREAALKRAAKAEDDAKKKLDRFKLKPAPDANNVGAVKQFEAERVYTQQRFDTLSLRRQVLDGSKPADLLPAAEEALQTAKDNLLAISPRNLSKYITQQKSKLTKIRKDIADGAAEKDINWATAWGEPGVTSLAEAEVSLQQRVARLEELQARAKGRTTAKADIKNSELLALINEAKAEVFSNAPVTSNPAAAPAVLPVEEEVDPAQTYAALTKGFPLAPSYDTLPSEARKQVDDLAKRGELNLAAISRIAMAQAKGVKAAKAGEVTLSIALNARELRKYNTVEEVLDYLAGLDLDDIASAFVLRLRSALAGSAAQFRVLSIADPKVEGLGTAFGMFDPNVDTVYVKDPSWGPDETGTRLDTVLHELTHAASYFGIQKGYDELASPLKFLKPKSREAKAVLALQDLMRRVEDSYAMDMYSGTIDPEVQRFMEGLNFLEQEGTTGVESTYYPLSSVHEFVAYAFSEPVFQSYLNSIPADAAPLGSGGTKPSLMSWFAAVIRYMLNMPSDADTMLLQVISITDSIMPDAQGIQAKALAFLPADQLPANLQKEKAKLERKAKPSAAVVQAKKPRKNKTLEKVQNTPTSSPTYWDGLRQLTNERKPELLVDKLFATGKALKDGSLRQLLPTLQTETLVEWANNLGLTNIGKAWRAIKDMNALQMKLMSSATPISDRLLELKKTSPDTYVALANAMHYATILRKDISDPKIRAGSEAQKQLWNKLDAKAQALYVDVRDYYKANMDLHYQALVDQVNKSTMEGSASDPTTPKGQLLASIRKNYERANRISPYFPLMRYGQFWVRIGGKGPSGEFHMFESQADKELFIQQWFRDQQRADPNADLEGLYASGMISDGNSIRDARRQITSQSVALKETLRLIDESTAGVFATTDDFGNSTTQASINDVEKLKDSIYQLYLQTLPEESLRKQFIHRQGKLGFSGDIARNFATLSTRMATQISRFKYAQDIALYIDSARDALQGDPKAARLREFVTEMQLRAKRELVPDDENSIGYRAANFANKAAFLYMMTSVKTAIAQFSAVPVFGMPVLWSRYGIFKTAVELGKLMPIWNSFGRMKVGANGTKSWIRPTIAESKQVKLNAEERRAIQYMQDRGLTDMTLAYDLGNRRSRPTEEVLSLPRRVTETVTNIMTGLFHHVERINREVMFMTAFRLARAKNPNMDFKSVVEMAEKDLTTAMFNFSSENRPRGIGADAERQVLLNAHKPLGKSILQFKMFPAAVTAYFVRNFYRMVGLEYSLQERKEAATQFFGTMFMSLSIAGVMGVPGVTLALGLLAGLRRIKMDEDDDDPIEMRDFEFWVRNKWLPDTFGDIKIGGVPLSNLLDRGVVANLTGYDMTSSFSLNNMWFPERKEQATVQADMTDLLISLLGPSVGLTRQVAGSIDKFNQGKIIQGMEGLLPAFLRSTLTAYRFSEEGATTVTGAKIKRAEDFTTGQIIAQAMGFSTEGLVAQREALFRYEGLKAEVNNERRLLMDRLSVEFNNAGDIERTLDQIIKFNRRNWFAPIDSETISQSLLNRMSKALETERGLQIEPKYYPQIRMLFEPSLQKLEEEASRGK